MTSRVKHRVVKHNRIPWSNCLSVKCCEKWSSRVACLRICFCIRSGTVGKYTCQEICVAFSLQDHICPFVSCERRFWRKFFPHAMVYSLIFLIPSQNFKITKFVLLSEHETPKNPSLHNKWKCRRWRQCRCHRSHRERSHSSQTVLE